MFDIGWPELMLIGLVALLVIGPKDLPAAIYGIGKWVRKARAVAREFQGHVDDMMREAELDDLRKQAMAARHLDFKDFVEKTVDPKGELRDATALPPLNEVGAAPPATKPVVDPSAPASPDPTAPSPTAPPPTGGDAVAGAPSVEASPAETKTTETKTTEKGA